MNKNEALNKLTSMVKGNSNENTIESTIPAASQKGISDAAYFLSTTESLPPEQRWAKFRREMDNWTVDYSNRDEVYELLHSVHPQGRDGSLKTLWNETNDTIKSFDSKEDIESYIKDNYYRLPSEFSKNLQEAHDGIGLQTAARDLEFKGRANMCVEFKNHLERLNLDYLNPNKSENAHVRDLCKAYHYGFMDQIKVDPETGNLTIPQSEGRMPASVLPDIGDQMLRFFADNDQAPIAKEFVKIPLTKSREDAKNRNRQIIEELKKNGKGTLPEDVQRNVDIDFALMQSNPVASLLETIKERAMDGVMQGKAGNFKDVARLYVDEQKKIEEALIMRRSGYVR
tara:strand:- start:9184 stop:10209 length:1026 start_codon:yes stop_codon:yes gene_type:complete